MKALNIQEKRLADISSETEQLEEENKQIEADIAAFEKELDSLLSFERINKSYNDNKRNALEIENEIKRLDKKISDIKDSMRELDGRAKSIDATLRGINAEYIKENSLWDAKYAMFLVQGSDAAATKLDMTEEELKEEFEKALGGTVDKSSLEKDKLLIDTLLSSIELETQHINDLGYSIDQLKAEEEAGKLIRSGEENIIILQTDIDRLLKELDGLSKKIDELKNISARGEGSIEYAKDTLVKNYGENSLTALSDTLELKDIPDIRDYEKALGEKKRFLEDARKELDAYISDSKNNDDLIRLAIRIADGSGIDIDMTDPYEDISGLRESFDNLLLESDKINKSIDRARSDMQKLALKVYETLNEIGAIELAASIRDDVSFPENSNEAEDLTAKLSELTEIISLEKQRIEGSIINMKQLKDSFIEECVERCLDVKTELDKLTKLSEITLDGKKLQMIRLTIPYVKEEFMRQHMADYIDSVVSDLDKKTDDRERQRFLNGSLSMKKLFSVIVTDMSKIRLMLYKRERIAEQSRYLRYEEAVGSTGQSQGIYIQFLISVINYIAGMYAAEDSTKRMKTIFIDNPFGAAKDVYIWEPIFRLLEENGCQLIVPARGATPEITGYFDINYVLGQQLTGSKLTTVVVNFSSRMKSEETDYHEIDYQQQSFDFI